MTRVSILATDPDFTLELFRVWFNGYEVTRVVSADEKTGVIVQYLVDEAGQAVIRDGEWITTTRRGGVSIDKLIF